ncbi:Integral membrane protein [Rhodovulum sp. PH10]|uniref:DUF805 domain-containing protein n=1 Tax=Rhodovulum sp. PH10 TaxID=1187851 RepID=UPI00027C20B6|nr:DUF805 domain-containing protein [Rhodovulum sp. PH10]EJW09686.1 Integral membrane protein [Rhodovulum sp. PH10]
MTFGQAIASGFRNYATFTGRAPRSEYWYWALFTLVVGLVASAIDTVLFGPGTAVINNLASLALFLPGLAVGARRLHDLDRTGWWLLLAVTVIGVVVLLAWFCFRGTDGPNRFGPDPLGEPLPATGPEGF